MVKGIFLQDTCWYLLLDLLEEREEEIITDEGSEFKICSLCIKNILAKLPSGSADDLIGVVLPTEGWYYILDLIDDRVGEVEDEEECEEEVWMLEVCQSTIWDGLNTDDTPFPEV